MSGVVVETIREQIERFLRETLAEHPGGIRRPELMQLAAERGLAPSTVGMIATEIGVEKIKQGRSPGIWRLPS